MTSEHINQKYGGKTCYSTYSVLLLPACLPFIIEVLPSSQTEQFKIKLLDLLCACGFLTFVTRMRKTGALYFYAMYALKLS